MDSKRLAVVCAVCSLAGVAVATVFWRGFQHPALQPAPVAPPVFRPSLVSPAPEAVAGEAAVPASGRIGYIDLESVYNQCKPTKNFDAEIGKLVEEMNKQLNPLHDELLKLKERHDVLGPQAPERAALEAEIRDKQKAGSAAQEPWMRDLNKKSLAAREKIYNLIRSAVQKVARDRGIDMVLADVEEPHANFTGPSSDDFERALQEYSMKMHRKSVLYASKDVDLTAAVLEAVNAEP